MDLELIAPAFQTGVKTLSVGQHISLDGLNMAPISTLGLLLIL